MGPAKGGTSADRRTYTCAQDEKNSRAKDHVDRLIVGCRRATRSEMWGSDYKSFGSLHVSTKKTQPVGAERASREHISDAR